MELKDAQAMMDRPGASARTGALLNAGLIIAFETGGRWRPTYWADGEWTYLPLVDDRRTAIDRAAQAWRVARIVRRHDSSRTYRLGWALGRAWHAAHRWVKPAVSSIILALTVWTWWLIVSTTPPLSGGTIISSLVLILGVTGAALLLKTDRPRGTR